MFLSSITIAELSFGIGVLLEGKRKQNWAAALVGVLTLFAARILPLRHRAGLAVMDPWAAG